MKFSIIITTHNDAHIIAEGLKSALDTGCDDIVIVDDGSSENYPPENNEWRSMTMMRQVTLCRCGVNRGAAAARNVGFKLATHDLVIPLDADDCFIEGGVKALINGIWDADIAYGFIFENGVLCYPDKGPLTRDSFLSKNPIFSSSLVRKSIWQRVGGYDESNRFQYEDYRFWIDCFLAGAKFQYVPAIVYDHKIREGSFSQLAKDKSEEYAEAARKPFLSQRKRVFNHGVESIP